jgi:hypothetical protein
MDQNHAGRVADDARAIAMALHFVPAGTEIGADGLIHRPAPSFVLAERHHARRNIPHWRVRGHARRAAVDRAPVAAPRAVAHIEA